MQYAAADLSSFYLDVLKDRLYCDAASRPSPPLGPDGRPPHRARPLPAARARASVHHRRGLHPAAGRRGGRRAPGPLPAPRARPTTPCSRAGPSILEVRAEVNKALEEARASKQVAASLEAAVTVSAARRRRWRRCASTRRCRRVFPGNLAQPLHRQRASRCARAKPRAPSASSTPPVPSASAAGHGRPRSARCHRQASASAAPRCWRSREAPAGVPAADGAASSGSTRLTKAAVVRSIELHGPHVPLVDGLLSLSHVRNRGAAFGLLSDWDLPYQSVLLSLLSLGALLAIAVYFFRLPAAARLPRFALALVLGGADRQPRRPRPPRLRGGLHPRLLATAPVARLQRRRLRDQRRRDAPGSRHPALPARTPLLCRPMRPARPPEGRTDMHPQLLTIPAFDLLGRTLGPFTLHTYGVLLAIAFLAACGSPRGRRDARGSTPAASRTWPSGC